LNRDSTLREILRVLALWIKGQFLIWLSVTGMYLAGFAIARTPLWALLAVLCGIVNVIPHFGALLSLLLVLFFSFLGSLIEGNAGSDGETWVIAAALGVWLVVQLIEGFILGPRLLGRTLGLNPWLVLLGGIAGAIVAGPIGILIATPLLAVAGVIWRRTRRPKPVKY
jgi:predicted PurR-regulated permease PerM